MKISFAKNLFFVLSLFLLGGCSTSTEPPATDTTPIPQQPPADEPDRPKTKDPIKSSSETNDLSDSKVLPAKGFTLALESVRGDEATFSWQIQEALLEGDRFRFVRSEESYPEFNGKNYWYQVHNSWREATWTDLPTGSWYVRLCTFDRAVTPEKCISYSNEVLVEIE